MASETETGLQLATCESVEGVCELLLPFTGRPLGTWTQEWVREANAVTQVVLSCAESQGVWKRAPPSEALKRSWC